MNKSKLMLIGWDAADWKIINPLLDQGLMPNLAKLVDNGTIGNLATMDPAYSPMLWTSIATGKHAYKHGIHGFLETTADGQGLKPIYSTGRKVKAIWEILSEKDYKCHVVGWWPSHPAEPMNGISISNFYQKENDDVNNWPLLDGCIFPASEHERFKDLRIHPQEMTGQHILPFIPKADKIDQSRDGTPYKIAQITAHAATIQAAFTNIIRNEEWDFAAVYFDAIDHYSHSCMKYHPPKQAHVSQHSFDLYNEVVTAGYRYHDMLLGRLMDLAGEETTIMLISDHGFQPDHLRPKEVPHEPGGPAYEHSQYGIIGMMGPGIKKDHLMHGAGLLDICPTILSHFGLPIGEDMDGKILTDSFIEKKEDVFIPSWEDVPFTKWERDTHTKPLDQDAESAMVDQLVALGYVEKLDEDMTKAVRSAESFNKFNLAKSYLFGNKIDEAIQLVEELVQDNPRAIRYKFFLASCYQIKGDLPGCRAIVDVLKSSKYYNDEAIKVMEASLLMGERKLKEAIKLLKSVTDQAAMINGKVHEKIVKCYLDLGHLSNAKKVIELGLELDYESPKLHFFNGLIAYRESKFQEVVDSLLISVGLDYNNQAAHRYIGLALLNLGEYEIAASSLEMCLHMRPNNNLARNAIIDLYNIHLDQPAKASWHRQQLNKFVKGEIIVVSGLPRSGTSMMMQMLSNAGLSIYTDSQRISDASNPKGYYEHNNVKTLAYNKKWIDECDGKVVKVISSLVKELPLNYKYKIIFMDRDIDEILQSQRKMIKEIGGNVQEEVYPIKLMNEFNKSRKSAKGWALKSPNVEYIEISYADVITSPFEQAIKISEFLNGKVAPQKLIEVIDPELYREKNEKLTAL